MAIRDGGTRLFCHAQAAPFPKPDAAGRGRPRTAQKTSCKTRPQCCSGTRCQSRTVGACSQKKKHRSVLPAVHTRNSPASSACRTPKKKTPFRPAVHTRTRCMARLYGPGCARTPQTPSGVTGALRRSGIFNSRTWHCGRRQPRLSRRPNAGMLAQCPVAGWATSSSCLRVPLLR